MLTRRNTLRVSAAKSPLYDRSGCYWPIETAVSHKCICKYISGWLIEQGFPAGLPAADAFLSVHIQQPLLIQDEV
jgi:hypothetical protein